MLSMQWGADLGLLIFFKDKLCCNVCIVIEIPEELCEVGVGEPGVKEELVGLACVCVQERQERKENWWGWDMYVQKSQESWWGWDVCVQENHCGWGLLVNPGG